ncbi:MAG: ComEC family competence protein [Pedobacter sp.]|nr:MAG: ComEC family competence protein [Pedobacter sp.]
MSSSSSVTNSKPFFVRLLIPFVMGIICTSRITVFAENIWIYCGLFGLTSLLLIGLCYVKLALYRNKICIGVYINIVVFVVGGWITASHDERNCPHHFSKIKSSYLKVRIDEEPQLKNGNIRFKAEVVMAYEPQRQAATNGKLMVTCKIDSSNVMVLKYGDVLLLPSNFKEVNDPLNPATFDYKTWLANKEIYHQCFLKSSQIKVLDSGKGNWLIDYLIKLRLKQVDYFKKVFKNDVDYAFCSTLILGYRTELDDEVVDIYSKTGTIHALSVSGMHVGLIYLFLNLALAFLNKNVTLEWVKTLTIILFIWFYALLTGFAPSILRSAVMITAFIIGKQVNRKTNGCNILAFTALVLLLYNPLYIWDIGFQLSFLSVLGLVYLHPMISNWINIEHRFLNKIWLAISISVAAQLITFPFSVYYFHSFPVYFLISNLFISIPTTLLMYFGILMLLFKLDFLAPVIEWLIWFTNSGLGQIAKFPMSVIPKLWLSEFELLFLILFVALLVCGLSCYNKRLIILSAVCLLLLQSASAYEEWTAFKQKKIIIYSLRGNYGVGFISGKTAIVMTQLQQDDHIFKKEIQPYLDKHYVNEVFVTSGNKPFKRGNLTIDANLIRFYDHVVDKDDLLRYCKTKRKAIVRDIR